MLILLTQIVKPKTTVKKQEHRKLIEKAHFDLRNMKWRNTDWSDPRLKQH